MVDGKCRGENGALIFGTPRKSQETASPTAKLGLACADVAIIHVVGDADDVVPVTENTGVVEQRYRALGGTIHVVRKPGVGHYPHGLDDPSPVVAFILRHESGKGAGTRP